ncbi:MAG: alpha/beta hydrolase [Eubacterium sp.]|nr:alpha/beta hydrolase [Eubacterium sp.]
MENNKNYVSVGDCNLYYEEYGSGKPFIMLHGNGEDCTYFAEQVKEFEKDYHIYLIDTRGHGKSERGTAPFTIRQFADDLNAFMEAKEIEKADILGFSDGGNILLLFAGKYPEKVDRIIANGANLDTTGIVAKVQAKIEAKYEQYCRNAEENPEDEKAVKNMEMFNLMVNDPNISQEDLDLIKAPTLVIAGSKDLVIEEHSYLIGNGIKDAETVIVEGSHFVAKENPEPFNKAVREFLAK